MAIKSQMAQRQKSNCVFSVFIMQIDSRVSNHSAVTTFNRLFLRSKSFNLDCPLNAASSILEKVFSLKYIFISCFEADIIDLPGISSISLTLKFIPMTSKYWLDSFSDISFIPQFINVRFIHFRLFKIHVELVPFYCSKTCHTLLQKKAWCLHFGVWLLGINKTMDRMSRLEASIFI